MSKKKISLLVIEFDVNSYLMPRVVNCLSERKNININILSYKKSQYLKNSNKIKTYSFFPPTSNKVELISHINNELRNTNFDLILPIDDLGFDAIVNNTELISNKYIIPILPTLKSYIIAINKGLLAEFLIENRIFSPTGFLIKPGADYAHKKDIGFPIIAKPTIGPGGGKGIFKFENLNEVATFFSQNKFEFDYLIQEFIYGYDIDCSVLCKDGEILAFTIQKESMQGSNNFSPGYGLKFIYEEEIYSTVKQLMKSLNWSGIAHVDLRYDEKDKIFKIIEINPRFWATIEASEIAGINFPHLYCLASLKVNFEASSYEFIEVLSFEGVLKSLKKNILFIFKFKFLLTNTPIKYYIKDPKGLMYILYYKRKLLMKKIRMF